MIALEPPPAPAASPADRPASLPQLPQLGVGVLYNAALPDLLRSDHDLVDYVEIVPDTFWTDDGMGSVARYQEIGPAVAILDELAPRLPLVAHSVGLSIGSADLFDRVHVEQIVRWQQRYGFPWHSDHLSFARVPGGAHELNAGLAVPVPYDAEVLDLIAFRVEEIQRRIPVPFLLENNVYYTDLPEQEMSEPEFLNRLATRTGCGLLLDVHNVYVNAVNHGFAAESFVDALDLDRVVEVHVAGGNEFAGLYTDSHAGPCPEPVWELLDRVVAGARRLAGITFEFHHSYYPLLGPDGLRRELDRARDAWARRT